MAKKPETSGSNLQEALEIAKKNDIPVNKTVQGSERLECILTDTERLTYSKSLAEHIEDKSSAEDNLKSFASQIKSEIAGHVAAINNISSKINTGREYRNVDIEIFYDYEHRQKVYTRKDNGTVFKTDIIHDNEMQLKMDLPD